MNHSLALTPRLVKLADHLFALGAVKFGAFKLKKHEREPDAPLSPYFFNLRTPENPKPGPLDPEIVGTIAEEIFELLRNADVYFDFVAPVPNAGAPIGAALAAHSETEVIPLLKREQGGKRRVTGIVDGFEVREGAPTVVIDDLVTEADSKLETIDVLRGAGLEVAHVAVLIDREQGGRSELARAGCTLHAVFTVRELLDYYYATNAIDATKYEEAIAYLAAERAA